MQQKNISFTSVEKFVFDLLKRKLPKDLKYHRPEHTKDVLAAAIRLGKKANINEHDMLLLKTAALFHDLGFIKRKQNNESIGAKLAQQHLPQFGYGKNDILKIKRMILATTVPQKPRTQLDKLLCDADLDNLGRNDCFAKSELVRKELSLSKSSQWQKNLLVFLTKHRYHSPEAQRLRNTQKQKNIKRLKTLLKNNYRNLY